MLNYIKFTLFIQSSFVGNEALGMTFDQVKDKAPRNAEKNDDLSHLPPESQEKVQELRKEFENVKAGLEVVGNKEEILRTRLLQQGDPKDKEFREIANGIQKLQVELKDLGVQSSSLQKELSTLLGEVQTEIKKLSPEETKALSKTDTTEFLQIPAEKRLQYVTKDHTDSADIASGAVKEVTFSFTYEGKLNQNLYKYTTAGQVLPSEVRSVTSKGETYERMGVNGEFYNKDQKRLTIHEGTQVSVEKLGGKDEMNQLNEKNKQAYQDFVGKNAEYAGEKYQFAIQEALEKGIEPKLFLKVLGRRIETFEANNEVDKAKVETIATQVSKIPGYSGTDIASQAKVLRYLTPTTWQQGLADLGNDQASIDKYTSENKDDSKYYPKYDISKLENFTPAEYSYPAERSESGTTLCSRTARMNLSRLGIDNPASGGSAKTSWEALGSPSEAFPPKDSNAKVADVYLDARSDANKQYGHRVAAFKGDGGKWFVLDPYYSMFGNTQKPIPAEEYVAKVGDKQKVWGAKYYA